jgi:hypothetical protein
MDGAMAKRHDCNVPDSTPSSQTSVSKPQVRLTAVAMSALVRGTHLT